MSNGANHNNTRASQADHKTLSVVKIRFRTLSTQSSRLEMSYNILVFPFVASNAT